NGTLATFIRLLQASTNPELLATNINYKELGLVDADSGVWDKQASTVEKENASSGDAYKKYDLANVESPKFEMGIDLIDKLVSQGKKSSGLGNVCWYHAKDYRYSQWYGNKNHFGLWCYSETGP